MSNTTSNTITDVLHDPAYIACRRADMPAKLALEMAHYFQHIKAEYSKWTLDLSQHWENEEVWVLETPEGRHEVKYDIDQTVSRHDLDGDLYDDVARTLYGAGQGADWWIYDVVAVFIRKDRMTGTAYLGGVDAGEYFKSPTNPLSADEQIFAVAIDYYKLHEQAQADAAGPGAEVTPWPEDERDTFDPMNVLGMNGYKWEYHEDECGMVFRKGDAYMTGEPIPGGVNLSLHNSFFNRTMVKDYPKAGDFVTAFRKTFDRLWDDYNGDD